MHQRLLVLVPVRLAIGFSMKTCFPACNRSFAISPCSAKSAETATASISSFCASSEWCLYRCGIPKRSWTFFPKFSSDFSESYYLTFGDAGKIWNMYLLCHKSASQYNRSLFYPRKSTPFPRGILSAQ